MLRWHEINYNIFKCSHSWISSLCTFPKIAGRIVLIFATLSVHLLYDNVEISTIILIILTTIFLKTSSVFSTFRLNGTITNIIVSITTVFSIKVSTGHSSNLVWPVRNDRLCAFRQSCTHIKFSNSLSGHFCSNVLGKKAVLWSWHITLTRNLVRKSFKLWWHSYKSFIFTWILVEFIFNLLILFKNIFKFKFNSLLYLFVFVDQERSDVLGVHSWQPEQ